MTTAEFKQKLEGSSDKQKNELVRLFADQMNTLNMKLAFVGLYSLLNYNFELISEDMDDNPEMAQQFYTEIEKILGE